jgi:hypothetical protein
LYRPMEAEIQVQGRRLGREQLEWIRGLLREHPDWHRTRVSREICWVWGWRNEAGQLKDMACRSMLLKLEARELVKLPARRQAPVNAARNRCLPSVEYSRRVIEGSLQALVPLRIATVEGSGEESRLFRRLIGEYHYLGLRNTVGENLKYLVRDRQGRVLCCLLFGSAAWRCKARDRFLGWDEATRRANLSAVTNNTRFLVLPWVRVKCLASHVLGRIARRIAEDWQSKYGHALWALETFVDRRFAGTCYRAANWRKVGRTSGRTRNDIANKGPLSGVKDVYVYGLAQGFRRYLCTMPELRLSPGGAPGC